MKKLNSISLIFFLFSSTGLFAQLTTSDQIWGGGLNLYGTETRATFRANPSFHQFLSPHFTIGGQLLMEGSVNLGIEQIRLAPELRYYLNPEDRTVNLFASLRSQFDLYSDQQFSGNTHFELQPGLGANIILADGLALESTLSANLQRLGATSFFSRPGLSFETNFVHISRFGGGDESDDQSLRINKGNWLLGGTLASLDFDNSKSVKGISAAFAPSVAYFLSNRFLVGADLAMTYDHVTTDFTFPESNITSHSFGLDVNPFIRYYTAKADRQIQPYLELRGSFSYLETQQETQGGKSSLFSRNYSASLGGGVDVILNKNTALEVGLHLGKDLRTGQTQVGLQAGLKFFLSRQR